MIHRLHRKIRLPIKLEEAWEFFSDPKNLAKITPAKLNFKILSDGNQAMYPGMIISYKVSPMLGIPITWVTEITHVKAKEYFVDEQRYGPYRMWHHQHIFKEVEGGVEVEDIVDYILPFGPLGLLVNIIFVKKQIGEIFDYRSSFLKERFGELVA